MTIHAELKTIKRFVNRLGKEKNDYTKIISILVTIWDHSLDLIHINFPMDILFLIRESLSMDIIVHCWDPLVPKHDGILLLESQM